MEESTQSARSTEAASARATTAPAHDLETVVVKTDSVIGIRLETPVASETAKVEDKIVARVTRDLTVDDRTAIPAGSKLEGYVTVVEKGGKFKDAARVGIRFTTLVSSDGKVRTPMQTETIFRSADSPAGQATAKIGTGAVVGAILGAVIGGKRGAIIGGTAGAAGGTATVAAGDRSDVTIPAGTPLTVRLTAPLTVHIERDRSALGRAKARPYACRARFAHASRRSGDSPDLFPRHALVS